MRPLVILAVTLSLGAAEPSWWPGTWTYDVCHEDRRADHDLENYCREGRDRIRVTVDEAGTWDITLCPADPWGERDVSLLDGGRVLTFRSREGHRVRLTLGEDRAHFTGLFRGADGHAGRIRGRRVAECR